MGESSWITEGHHFVFMPYCWFGFVVSRFCGQLRHCFWSLVGHCFCLSMTACSRPGTLIKSLHCRGALSDRICMPAMLTLWTPRMKGNFILKFHVSIWSRKMMVGNYLAPTNMHKKLFFALLAVLHLDSLAKCDYGHQSLFLLGSCQPQL